MKPGISPAPANANEEIFALIETLHQTEQRLEELTAGEVDTVADRAGRTLLLRRAQDHLRHNEAAKQAAVLHALATNETRLRTLVQAIPDLVWLKDAEGVYLECNPMFERLYGAGEANIIGKTDYDFVDREQADFFRMHDRKAMAACKSSVNEEWLTFSDNGYHGLFETIKTPMLDGEGRLIGVLGVSRDITERKAAAVRIAYLNRVYAMLSGINTLIVRVHDRDELFREACRIAVEVGGFRMSLIAILDPSLMIVPVATAGKDEQLLSAINSILSSRENAPNSLLALAVREKKAVVSNDSKNDPRVLLVKEYAEAGVCSMAIFPLIVSNEVAGVLALYRGETDFFHQDELKLLTELSGDIAFALDHIGKRERLDYLSYYDALTGLANRTLFLDRLEQYRRSADSGGHKLALFLIDLERFRNINDSLGQLAGDDLLKQVAEWLLLNVGDVTLLARVGADHFAVVLPEVRQGGEVARLLEKRMQAFQEHPFCLNDAVFRIPFKAGVVIFPDDGADAEILFRNAEAALKQAKSRGEHYLFYTQSMNETAVGRLTLENQMRRAFDKQEFVLHYQPKVNLVGGNVSSAEGLIRWNDPLNGLTPPGKFISILEETGLIHEVGRWAMHKAIEEHLRWRSLGLAAVRIAVNVSPLQLRHRGFIAEVERAIGIDRHAAAGLELEITESLIMEDVKHSIATLQAIRAMGISIAIDDFGTGFSSLSYLAKLPVDTLKIDRSFVIDMTEGPEGLALVSTIISLAHSMKLKVVAEGVETDEQWRLLRLLDCDEIQGFIFSEAVPGEVFQTKFLLPLPYKNSD